MPFPWATAITAGSSLLGGILGSKGDDDAASQAQFDRDWSRQEGARRDARDYQAQERWNLASYNEARRQFDTLQSKTIQNRVADAKAAGLHPLYALGASAGSGVSPAFNVGRSAQPAGSSYYPDTGSRMGEAISAAGAAVGAGMRRQTARKRQSRIDELNEGHVLAQMTQLQARASLDEARAMATASEMKRAEQRAMITRLPPERASGHVPVKGRPMRNVDRMNAPEKAYVVTDDGEKLPVLHPESAMDEVGQAYYLYERARKYARDKFTQWGNSAPSYRRQR